MDIINIRMILYFFSQFIEEFFVNITRTSQGLWKLFSATVMGRDLGQSFEKFRRDLLIGIAVFIAYQKNVETRQFWGY